MSAADEHPTGKPAAERLRIENRFWEKVDWDAGDDECWEWQAATFESEYGAFQANGARRAHRIAYELVHGSIPDGQQLNHTCDNRACVNPSHLYPGTQQDNIRDAIERDRMANQIPTETVIEIRERYETEDITQEDLADEFDTAQSAVSRIVRGVAYDYID